MDSDLSAEPGGPTSSSPVTERMLRRLGPPRWLWIALWSLIPLVSPFVFSTAIRLSGKPFGTGDFIDLFATQAVLAFACFVLLWGGGLVWAPATAARQDLVRVVPGGAPADLFGRIGSVGGPLSLTVIVVGITSANGWATYGPLPPLAALPLQFAYMLPILTFVWVLLAVLFDIDRLGRQPLALDLFPQDRTLGLEQLGWLASTGLGLVLIAAVPVLLAGSDEPVTLGISLAVVAVTVAIFVLSMWRLHRQMAAAKARYVVLARQLYAEAYAPVRNEATVRTLGAQGSALRAAQSLDERAQSLQTWPIDEGTVRFIAVIVTGVVTSLVVRGLFAALGF